MNEPDDESDFLPTYRNILVYCDDSGINQRFYGWGSVWIPEEARGRLSQWMQDLKDANSFPATDEVKWHGVSNRTRRFFEALIDEFFEKDWMAYHGIYVRKSWVDKKLHTDPGQARLKHLNVFLKKKVQFFSKAGIDSAYHVRVDPLGAHSGYSKEHEKAQVITNAMLTNTNHAEKIASFRVRDSKLSAGIQLADVLLGATIAPWQRDGPIESVAKAAISRRVYEHLGWTDHRADTSARVWKFNMWHWFPPNYGFQRYARERRVVFRTKPVPYRG